MTNWQVVPLSQGQLKDVRQEDILENGLYRKCLTYRGGGGYDQFPYICEAYTGVRAANQFVVQVRGCNLDCPYCYVTREGVWGNSVTKTTDELIKAFVKSRQEVFHLMGGAPALYLHKWPELVEATKGYIFHSDFMLTERLYSPQILKSVAASHAVYAIDVKGLDQEEHLENTRKPFAEERFYQNLDVVMRQSGLQVYFTYTNVSENNRRWFEDWLPRKYGQAAEVVLDKSFGIDLIDYEALGDVDNIPWGGLDKSRQPH